MITLHRDHIFDYTVSNWPLAVRRGDRGWRLRAWWLGDEGMREWVHRNEDLFRTSFLTLRELREGLAACVELDPIPYEYPMLPESALIRLTAGNYRVQLPSGECLIVNRRGDFWRIEPSPVVKDWVTDKPLASLWELRCYLGDL